MLVEPDRDVVVISDVPRVAQADLVKESRQVGHPTQQDFGTARITLRGHGRHSLWRPSVALQVPLNNPRLVGVTVPLLREEQEATSIRRSPLSLVSLTAKMEKSFQKPS